VKQHSFLDQVFAQMLNAVEVVVK